MKFLPLSSVFLVMTGLVNGALATPVLKAPAGLSPAKPIQIRPEKDPFWKSKQDVYQRILERRAVIVSVQTKEPQKKGQKKELYMQGAGLVSAPVDFTYQEAKNFQNLVDMSTYVHEISYHKKRQQLFMHSEAFNYHARMLMKVEFEEDPEQKQIRYRIIKGVFEGMEGVLAFEDYERRKTQISMTASYEFDKLPVPAFFARFGLEVVLQKMAARIRSFVEEKYRSRHQKGTIKEGA